MTVHSLYIFDRHCNCVYYQDWHRSKPPKPAVEGGILPAVSRAVTPRTAASDGNTTSTFTSPRNTLNLSSGIVVAVNEEPNAWNANEPPAQTLSSTGLPFDEETKLVYGVILSLRNMVKKLTKRDEQFTNYRTSTYKMHLYETISGYKFLMLTDPRADSVRYILRQLYSGPFLDYVVRNPIVDMDSREHGIDNEYFRASVDRIIRGLSIFQ